jgi:hypothetical protein
MENLSAIDIRTRKRAPRNWLVLLRNHGSDCLFQELYLWYLDNMDSEFIPVQIAQVVAEELSDAQERYSSSSSNSNDFQSSSYSTPEGFLNRIYDRDRYLGRSKWERIGKPFVEDMVSLNAKIHFWNPAGGVLRKMQAYMLANEDWDDFEATLERLLDPDGDGLYGN